MYPPHIFADNPINRGEVERRDEDWIIQQSQEPRSKFLPFRNLNVLLTDDSRPNLAGSPPSRPSLSPPAPSGSSSACWMASPTSPTTSPKMPP